MPVSRSLFTPVSTPPAAGGRPGRTGSGAGFENCLKTAERSSRNSDPVNDRNPSAVPENGRVRLGVLSATAPTVSHLLVRHPDFSRDCWKIIHSEINRDKPYTRIPAGTAIYLDPRTNKITWDAEAHPTGNGPPAYAAPVSSRKQAANADHERSLIEKAVAGAAADYDLPRELIHGVIKAESDFRVRAVSRAGARGLMQLMPGTAKELGVDDPFDIRQNIDAGARYLKQMLDLFEGNLEQALAAYNAGPGTMKRHNGRIPYRETRLFVQRVLSFIDREV